MDIVYPYKHSHSQELEYSLKSLKNVQHGEVFIVSDDTTRLMINNSTIIRPQRNHWARYSPYHDVINKLLTICDHTDEFILMNDDFFFMSQNKIIKNYNRGTLIDHMNARKYDTYARALRNTHNLLREKGYDALDFELHTPMVFKSDLLKIAIAEMMPYLFNSRSLMIRSYYANRFGIESEYSEDVKNPKNYKELPIISTNEMTFAGEIGAYIKEKL